MSDLDARLLAAYVAGDRAGLVALYTEAAERVGKSEARWFFLTQAYVFALEAGLPVAAALKARLVASGRDTA